MDFDAYQKGAARTLPDGLDANATLTTALSGVLPETLVMSALGLAGEAGEFVELVKKHLFHGAELDREKAAKELGDVLWYVAAACTALGVSMDEVAAGNLRKLEARYPTGFSAEASAARADEAYRAGFPAFPPDDWRCSCGKLVPFNWQSCHHCGAYRTTPLFGIDATSDQLGASLREWTPDQPLTSPAAMRVALKAEADAILAECTQQLSITSGIPLLTHDPADDAEAGEEG